MSFRNRSLCVCAIFAAATLIGGHARSQTTSPNAIELIVSVRDTIALSGQHNVRIPIRMSNYFDTVAGFEMWVTTDRPDLVTFSRSLDTIGCLASGWEYIGTELIGGNADTLRIVGLADYPFPSEVHPGIPPQYGTTLLLYLKAEIRDFRDSLDIQDVTVQLPTDNASHFMFSTAAAKAIGLETDSTADTTFFHCESWNGDVCELWNQIGGPPWDSLDVVWTTQVVLDTAAVKVVNGSLKVHPAMCGDVTGFDRVINLADITKLIAFVYLGGSEPPSRWASNVDGSVDGKLNLSDITRLVASVYLHGAPPACL